MCGRSHRAMRRGRRLGGGWYNRERVLDRLEEYQRDLEQEVADVSELIRRLRAGEADVGEQPEPQPA